MNEKIHPNSGQTGLSRLMRVALSLASAAILGAALPGFATPTMQIIYPIRGAEIEGTVNLRIFAYEGAVQTQTAQIDTVKFFRKADTTNKILLVRIASSGEWSGAWSAASLSAGSDTLVFRAINNGGGTKTDSTINITIVNGGTVTAPTVNVTIPTAGATISGTQTITFTATAGTGTISTREISVDGAAYVATSGTTTHSLNTVPLAEGSHTIRLRITNSSGSASETRLITYIVVNTPTVTWNSPAGSSITGGRLIFDYTATPMGQASITSDSLLIDGQGFATLNTPSGPDTVDIHSLADGTHTFQIKTTDSNGKTGLSKQVALLVRNGPWVAWLTPVAGTTVAGTFTLTYKDSATTLATVVSDSLLIDGKVQKALSLTGTDTFNSTTLPDGEHTFQVKTTDDRGRVGTSTLVTLLVRNSPLVLIDSALADSTVSGRLVIRFRITPVAPATVALRQISIDGGAFRTAGGDSTDTLDTRKLSDGAHTAQIRGVDNQGKEGLSRLVKFNVRNAPTVTITSPAVDAYVRGTVTVKFKATAVAPDTIKTTEISLGGGDWIPTTTDSTYTLDTRDFKDGDLRFQVRVKDGSGKSALTLAREIAVDNSAPKVSYPTVSYPADAPSARMGVEVIFTAQALDLGSGMDKDSAVVLKSQDLQIPGTVMHDDGQAGDKVKGDNVYSSRITIDTALTGSASYSIRVRDALSNDSTVLGTLLLDNLPPVLAFSIEPAPSGHTGALTGEVYISRVLMQGQFSDSGGSGMRSLEITVRNDSGSHVNNSPEGIPLVDGRFRRVIELVPGKNHLDLIGLDRAGNVDTVSALITYTVPKETKLISGQGGRVFGQDGSGVDIPADVLGSAKEITVTAVSSQQEPKPLDTQVKLLGLPHEFGPDGTIFPEPVTVTLSYTVLDLDPNQDGKADFDESKLTIVFWNGHAWVKAGDARIDRNRHLVSVTVNHFTLFDLAEDVSSPPSSLVAFWDRNPVPGNSEFIYKVPKPGKVSLHILDMGGDIVKTLIQPNTPVAISGSVRWDGSNVRGLSAGAGLYVYVFKYTSNDGKVDKLIRKPVGLVGK